MAQSAAGRSGLTSAEVQTRVAAGQTNAVRSRTSRSVATIVRANVFTWFNLILGVDEEDAAGRVPVDHRRILPGERRTFS